MTPTITPTQTAQPDSHNGDVDGDYEITPGDSYLAMQLYLEISVLGTDSIAADFCPQPFGNGSIDPGDAYGILKEYLHYPNPCD